MIDGGVMVSSGGHIIAHMCALSMLLCEAALSRIHSALRMDSVNGTKRLALSTVADNTAQWEWPLNYQ